MKIQLCDMMEIVLDRLVAVEFFPGLMQKMLYNLFLCINFGRKKGMCKY